jgi:uncharacterized membrane protein
METTSQTPSSDERLLATLAHFLGLIVALIIWAMQKDRSRYVRFQALQAMAFNGIVMLFTMLFAGCLVAVMSLGIYGTMFAAIESTTSSGTPDLLFLLPYLFPFGTFLCMMPISLAIFCARLVSAVSVFSGRDFRYPWLGKRVEDFLQERS